VFGRNGEQASDEGETKLKVGFESSGPMATVGGKNEDVRLRPGLLLPWAVPLCGELSECAANGIHLKEKKSSSR